MSVRTCIPSWGAPRESCAADAPWRDSWRSSIFLAFAWAGYLVLLLGAGISILLLQPGLKGLHEWVFLVVTSATASGVSLTGAGLALITVTVLTGVDVLYPHNGKSLSMRVLLPITLVLCDLTGFSKDRLRVSYLRLSNSLWLAQRKRLKAERILVLLPHCLQIDTCHRKITSDVTNCVRCGKCLVASLLELSDRYRLSLEIANGGTSARQKIRKFRPDGVVAVACERDLLSGVQDAFPIPVFGVINDRPYGPCLNTQVDLRLVEQGIRFFRGLPSRMPGTPIAPSREDRHRPSQENNCFVTRL